MLHESSSVEELSTSSQVDGRSSNGRQSTSKSEGSVFRGRRSKSKKPSSGTYSTLNGGFEVTVALNKIISS